MNCNHAGSAGLPSVVLLSAHIALIFDTVPNVVAYWPAVKCFVVCTCPNLWRLRSGGGAIT